MLLFWMLLSCTSTANVAPSVCAVDLTAATPAEAGPGETVVLSASPLTTIFDTAVFVDGERALINGVSRDNCDSCDACRALDLDGNGSSDCAECGDCDSCDRLCEESCAETIEIVIPETVEAGARAVQVFNAFGVSGTLTLNVVENQTDTGSSSSEDSGVTGGDSGATR